MLVLSFFIYFFFFQAEDGIRDIGVTGVQTCALPIFYVDPHLTVVGVLAREDGRSGGAAQGAAHPRFGEPHALVATKLCVLGMCCRSEALISSASMNSVLGLGVYTWAGSSLSGGRHAQASELGQQRDRHQVFMRSFFRFLPFLRAEAAFLFAIALRDDHRAGSVQGRAPASALQVARGAGNGALLCRWRRRL